MDNLFELPAQNLKSEWIREAGKVMNVIRELEAELKRMKANDKVKPEFIEAKDNQINELVSFYNATDKLINNYQMQVTFHRINDKLNCQIFKDGIQEG
jgi:hypothetical protein